MPEGGRVIIGIGGILGHDSNAALIVDGKVAAASQEERFTRIKHDSSFPERAIRDCCSLAGCVPAEVDVCVFADKPLQALLARRLDRPSNWLTWQIGRALKGRVLECNASARGLLPGARLRYAWHHLSHAALAFASSPYERAAFLCVDGTGDDVNATVGIADAARTEITHELAYEFGIGHLYSMVTAVLGFGWIGAEYKVMGLAPFGRPVFVERLRALGRADAHGAVRLHDGGLSPDDLVRRTAGQLGIPARAPGEPLGEDHVNLAASLQAFFEETLLRMARYARQVTGEDRLLLCGGCAQNSVAGGRLRACGIFEDVFVSPVPGDMGTGLGAALLYRQKSDGRGDGKTDVSGLYLGSPPGPVPEEAQSHEIEAGASILETAAGLLARGKILGWVHGRMELGARALGARSILAHPGIGAMRATLNERIKHREPFRPFAPAVLAEDCPDWFECAAPSDYMQYVTHVRPDRRFVPAEAEPGAWPRSLDVARCDIPAVVHVDYSSRVQTVRRDVHPRFHGLISAFKRATGLPMLVNTSFNLAGEPIVRTAEDAWSCFRRTEIDYLVIEDRLFAHPRAARVEERS